MLHKRINYNLSSIKTPAYFYDIALLQETLGVLKQKSEEYNFNVHYALKANSNPGILKEICLYGFGADCVSGNEIQRAIDSGFLKRKLY